MVIRNGRKLEFFSVFSNIIYCPERARCAEELLLDFCRPPLFQSPHASAGMAGAGELQRLFRTFLSLKRSCQRAEVTFYSDRDGDCHVTLRVTTPRHGYQTPRAAGGATSRSQEKQGSGAQNPHPVSEGVSATQKTPSAPAPVPARRSRRRGPAAILRVTSEDDSGVSSLT